MDDRSLSCKIPIIFIDLPCYLYHGDGKSDTKNNQTEYQAILSPNSPKKIEFGEGVGLKKALLSGIM